MMRPYIAISVVWLAISVITVGATEPLRFGNQWDEYYKQLSTEDPALMPRGWRTLIRIPPPPDDAFTRTEVDYIIALRSLRPQYQKQIEAQITDVVHPFATSLNLSETQIRALQEFWEPLVVDITRVHMHFKAKFDRARPRQYSIKVAPSIDPPGHPAYPSGHSTDAHTLALLLAEIWPERTTQFLSIAIQIAVNREVAGVHYRSDTAAGYLLAQQIVALLPQNPKAKALITALRSTLRLGK